MSQEVLTYMQHNVVLTQLIKLYLLNFPWQNKTFSSFIEYSLDLKIYESVEFLLFFMKFYLLGVLGTKFVENVLNNIQMLDWIQYWINKCGKKPAGI